MLGVSSAEVAAAVEAMTAPTGKGAEEGVSTSTSSSGGAKGRRFFVLQGVRRARRLISARSRHSSESEEGDAVRAAQACCGALHESLRPRGPRLV